MAWVAVGLTAASVVSGLLGKKKEKKAAKAQQRGVAIQNRKARLDAVKEFRAARAAVISGTVERGAQGSSAELGVIGSLGTQLQEETQISMDLEATGVEANRQLAKANRYATIGQAFGLAGDIYGALPGGGKTTKASGNVGQPPKGVNTSPFAGPTQGYVTPPGYE